MELSKYLYAFNHVISNGRNEEGVYSLGELTALHIPAQRERSYWPSVNNNSGLTVNKHTGFSVNDFC
jgi:hypothetical protein